MNDKAASWSIRKARPEDLDALLQVYDEAVVWLNAHGITTQWGTTPVSSRVHVVKEITGLIDFGCVAEADELLGFIAFNSKPDSAFAEFIDIETLMSATYVHSLVARRTQQARGIGVALLRYAEENARAMGHETFLLSCYAENPKLIAHYESFGLTRCGVAYENGRGEQLFRKDIR